MSYYAKYHIKRLIIDWANKKAQLELHDISYYRLQMSILDAFNVASYKS